jgi:hypothetical protein
MRFTSALATALGRRSDQAEMLSLENAASAALAEMRKRGLPLARLADMGRSDADARLWVGDNMLQNAAVLGRNRATSTFSRIADGERRRLRLLPDWSGAAPEGSTVATYETLSIARTDMNAYLDWARSVA